MGALRLCRCVASDLEDRLRDPDAVHSLERDERSGTGRPGNSNGLALERSHSVAVVSDGDREMVKIVPELAVGFAVACV